MEEQSMGSYMGNFVKPALKIWLTKQTTFADLKECFALSSRKQTSAKMIRIHTCPFQCCTSCKVRPQYFSVSAEIKNTLLIRSKSLNGLAYERDSSLNMQPLFKYVLKLETCLICEGLSQDLLWFCELLFGVK